MDIEKMRKKYVKDRGRYCPHCGSSNLWDTGESSQEHDELFVGKRCAECDNTWVEVYALRTIILEEDE